MRFYHNAIFWATIKTLMELPFMDGDKVPTTRNEKPPKHIQEQTLLAAAARQQRRRERNLLNQKRGGWVA